MRHEATNDVADQSLDPVFSAVRCADIEQSLAYVRWNGAALAMKNFWVQTEMEQVAWCGELPRSTAPSAVLELLGEVARAAVVEEVALLDVQRVRAELGQRLHAERRIDCSLTRGRAPSARCAWFNGSDEITEGLVVDLGALLHTLEPEPGAIWARHRSSWSPLSIRGGVVDVDVDAPCALSAKVHLGIATFSDIWFPFVLGNAHPSYDGRRYFDNRELASHHTPRLNRFLRRVAELVSAAGGEWAIDDGVIAPQLRSWVGEHGILLDGPVPPLMPPELVDVPWPSLDD